MPNSNANPCVSARTRLATSGSRQYPSGYDGGATTTAASSVLLGPGSVAKACVIYGLFVEGGTLGLITLEDHAGNTLMTFTPPAAGEHYFPRAIYVAGGWRALVAGTGMTVQVFWDLD